MKKFSEKIRNKSKFIVFVSSLSLGLPFAVGADGEEVLYDKEILSEIGTILDKLYYDGRIPNYVVDIKRGDQQIYFGARGTTELGGDVPVTEDSIYMLASMSKPIVSTAILKLIDEGRIELDDPLSTFYPQFESMLVAPNGDLDVPFEEANKQITIRHLLTHTSGFTYPPQVLGLGDVAEQYNEIGLLWGAASTLEEFVDILSQIPLVSHPGETFNYSVSTDVLGAVIQKVTGQRLSAYLRENIFEPLGMSNTDFFVPEEKRKLMPRIYAPATPNNPAPTFDNGDIKWEISEAGYFGLPFEAIGLPPAYDSGGGGLFSSSRDFLRYAQMVANYGELDGVRILSAESASLHYDVLMPNLGLEGFQVAFGDAAKYMNFGGGYGIKMEEDGSGTADYFFWGGANNTFFWIDLEDQSVGTFYTHISPPRYNMSDQIEEVVDRARLP